MSEELMKKIVKDCYTVFPKGRLYLECNSGWLNILYTTSKKIHDINIKHGINCQAVQIKEKFGTLRYYVTGANDEQYKVIEEAEQLSEVTCEECGSTGDHVKTQGPGWIRTICRPECKDKDIDPQADIETKKI